MKYATWVLNWNDPEYGTGPESAASAGSIEAGPALGEVTEGAAILGYATDDINFAAFGPWAMTEISQQQALDLALALDAGAFIHESGRIGFPAPPMP